MAARTTASSNGNNDRNINFERKNNTELPVTATKPTGSSAVKIAILAGNHILQELANEMKIAWSMYVDHEADVRIIHMLPTAIDMWITEVKSLCKHITNADVVVLMPGCDVFYDLETLDDMRIKRMYNSYRGIVLLLQKYYPDKHHISVQMPPVAFQAVQPHLLIKDTYIIRNAAARCNAMFRRSVPCAALWNGHCATGVEAQSENEVFNLNGYSLSVYGRAMLCDAVAKAYRQRFSDELNGPHEEGEVYDDNPLVQLGLLLAGTKNEPVSERTPSITQDTDELGNNSMSVESVVDKKPKPSASTSNGEPARHSLTRQASKSAKSTGRKTLKRHRSTMTDMYEICNVSAHQSAANNDAMQNNGEYSGKILHMFVNKGENTTNPIAFERVTSNAARKAIVTSQTAEQKVQLVDGAVNTTECSTANRGTNTDNVSVSTATASTMTVNVKTCNAGITADMRPRVAAASTMTRSAVTCHASTNTSNAGGFDRHGNAREYDSGHSNLRDQCHHCRKRLHPPNSSEDDRRSDMPHRQRRRHSSRSESRRSPDKRHSSSRSSRSPHNRKRRSHRHDSKYSSRSSCESDSPKTSSAASSTWTCSEQASKVMNECRKSDVQRALKHSRRESSCVRDVRQGSVLRTLKRAKPESSHIKDIKQSTTSQGSTFDHHASAVMQASPVSTTQTVANPSSASDMLDPGRLTIADVYKMSGIVDKVAPITGIVPAQVVDDTYQLTLADIQNTLRAAGYVLRAAEMIKALAGWPDR